MSLFCDFISDVTSPRLAASAPPNVAVRVVQLRQRRRRLGERLVRKGRCAPAPPR